MSSLKKTITISEGTYKDLSKYGTLNDTYDSTIARLIKSATSKQERATK